MPAASPSASGDTYVTPIVRKLAKQHGVDLAAVTGTGVGGRIRKQDVLDAASRSSLRLPASAPPALPAAAPAAAAEPSPLRGKTEKVTRLRKTIATRMVQSLQVSAQLTQVHEVDVTEVARLRARAKDAFLEREGVKLTFLPFFAKAADRGAQAVPAAQRRADFEAGTITYPTGEHLGIAVDTERGLLVPTIKDAGDLSVAGLATQDRRRRRAHPHEQDLARTSCPVRRSRSPTSAATAPCSTRRSSTSRRWRSSASARSSSVPSSSRTRNGGESIAVRTMAYLALTYDHRIVDGADAGRFLTAVKSGSQAGSFEGELGS